MSDSEENAWYYNFVMPSMIQWSKENPWSDTNTSSDANTTHWIVNHAKNQGKQQAIDRIHEILNRRKIRDLQPDWGSLRCLHRDTIYRYGMYLPKGTEGITDRIKRSAKLIIQGLRYLWRR